MSASLDLPGLDTALAQFLHAHGRLELPLLQELLAQARARRAEGLTLARLLAEHRLVPRDELQTCLTNLQGDTQPDTTLRAGPGVTLPPGTQLGPYRVLRRLGAGGMGAVYEAEHPELGARYALKVLAGAEDPELVLRFRREGEAQASVGAHRHVARVHALGEANGWHYLVMDLIEGPTLGERLRTGPLEPDEAIRLVRDLARGLAHVHAQGVLHRDLKPDNVIFDTEGIPKLVDFGIAALVGSQRLTQTGTVMGTPAFMAPEQAQGLRDQLDVTTDVYALGALLYRCLSGAPPFEAPSVLQLLHKVVNEAPPSLSGRVPGVSPELDAVLLRALAKRPAARPRDAGALADALDEVLSGEAEAPLPLRRVIAVAVALLILALIPLLVDSRARQREQAQTRFAEYLEWDGGACARDPGACAGGDHRLAAWDLGIAHAGTPEPASAPAVDELRAHQAALGELSGLLAAADEARLARARVRLEAHLRLLAHRAGEAPDIHRQPELQVEPTSAVVDAIILLDRGELSAAHAQLERALALAPRNRAARLLVPHLLRTHLRAVFLGLAPLYEGKAWVALRASVLERLAQAHAFAETRGLPEFPFQRRLGGQALREAYQRLASPGKPAAERAFLDALLDIKRAASYAFSRPALGKVAEQVLEGSAKLLLAEQRPHVVAATAVEIARLDEAVMRELEHSPRAPSFEAYLEQLAAQPAGRVPVPLILACLRRGIPKAATPLEWFSRDMDEDGAVKRLRRDPTQAVKLMSAVGMAALIVRIEHDESRSFSRLLGLAREALNEPVQDLHPRNEHSAMFFLLRVLSLRDPQQARHPYRPPADLEQRLLDILATPPTAKALSDAAEQYAARIHTGHSRTRLVPLIRRELPLGQVNDQLAFFSRTALLRALLLRRNPTPNLEKLEPALPENFPHHVLEGKTGTWVSILFGHPEEAWARAERSLSVYPRDIELLRMAAQIQMARGRLDEAEALARRLLRLRGRNSLGHATLAAIAWARGDLAEADLRATTGLALNEKHAQLNLLSVSLALQQGELEEGLRRAASALKLHSQNVHLHWLTSELYWRLGARQESRAHLAPDIPSGRLRTLTVRIVQAWRDGKLDVAEALLAEAEAVLKQLAETQPERHLVLRRHAIRLRSESVRVAYLRSDFAEGERRARRVLAEERAQRLTWSLRVRLALAAGNREEAWHRLQQALLLHPFDWELLQLYPQVRPR